MLLFTSQWPCLVLRKSSTVLYPWCLHKGSASFSVIVSVLSEESCSFLSQRQVLAGNKNLVGKQRVSVYEFSFFFFFWCPWGKRTCICWSISWRRRWQPIPVSLSGKSHGQWNLVGYSPWGCKELDVNEWLSMQTCLSLQNCFRCFAVFAV